MTDLQKRERRRASGNRRSKAGETLTETLIAMLIIGLSSVLFLTMVGASGRIFRSAKTQYEEAYKGITASIKTEFSDPSIDLGKITVKGEDPIGGSTTTVTVDWYGNKDYVLSYACQSGVTG